jgi:hypothetical protein
MECEARVTRASRALRIPFSLATLLLIVISIHSRQR